MYLDVWFEDRKRSLLKMHMSSINATALHIKVACCKDKPLGTEKIEMV